MAILGITDASRDKWRHAALAITITTDCISRSVKNCGKPTTKNRLGTHGVDPTIFRNLQEDRCSKK
jgi:hypothetical protein